MDLEKILVEATEMTDDEDLCVVRVRHSFIQHKGGLRKITDINFLRRKSRGYQLLEDDAKNIGAQEVIERIEDLDTLADGVYYVSVTNVSTDWETGYVDDYDYSLTPFKE